MLCSIIWQVLQLEYSLTCFIKYSSLFIKTGHRYELRNKMTYVLPKPNTDYLKKSISYQAVTLWNSLDKELKSTVSLAKFKKSVKALQL